MGVIEKIKEIEAEMAKTQKNKATGKLLPKFEEHWHMYPSSILTFSATG
jgi:ribosome-interacting GTPase 1